MSVDTWPHPYGRDDRRGALNEVTAGKVLEATGLVRQSKVYRLDQVLDPASPSAGRDSYSQVLVTSAVVNPKGRNDASSVSDVVYTRTHVGTHIDGLAHSGVGGLCYGGRRYADIISPSGLKDLGMEAFGPLVTRGVVMDIAGALSEEYLPAGYAITPDDLEAADRRAGVTIERGDALLLHTGWSRFWGEETYQESEPGIGSAAAQWITDRGVVLIGADTWGIEVVPFEQPGIEWAVHQHCLALHGCYLLENVATAAMVADGVVECCFMLAPHAMKGATGAQAVPVAIV